MYAHTLGSSAMPENLNMYHSLVPGTVGRTWYWYLVGLHAVYMRGTWYLHRCRA